MTPEQKERKKEYNKQYRQKNKEQIKEYNKQYATEYYKDNKEHLNEYNKEYSKVWEQTPQAKKSRAIKNWRRIGVIHEDFDKLYALYIATTECNVCNKVFKSTIDRHLDHNHETGLFRYVLCCSCNTKDNWKNKI